MVAILLAVATSVPTPSPTISPLPSAIVQWYAQRGADASGLDISLVRAVIDAESGGDPKAVSKAGAIGMMQLEPATAGDCGIHDRFDPGQNVECGARTLAYLVHRYGVETGIAAYNFGPGSVDAVGGHFTKMPLETQQYVKSVIDDYDDRQHEDLTVVAPSPTPAPAPAPLPAFVLARLVSPSVGVYGIVNLLRMPAQSGSCECLNSCLLGAPNVVFWLDKCFEPSMLGEDSSLGEASARKNAAARKGRETPTG
jgi:Transglycosylase SLT domain